jgi:hypothetical protein
VPFLAVTGNVPTRQPDRGAFRARRVALVDDGALAIGRKATVPFL